MFELFHLYQDQDFVFWAFAAGTVVAIVSAIVGYFAVLRSQTFAAHALSHIGFAGSTGAALFGISSFAGMFLFTILAALGMGALGNRLRGRDIEIGMFLSFVLGLGVLFLNLYTQQATSTVNLLFGSLWTVRAADVRVMLLCGLGVLVILACIFRPLLFASIDPQVARVRGVPVRLLSLLFMVLLAITIAEAVQVIGVLLSFALLVVPAASAEHLVHRPLAAIGLAILLGLGFTWGGILLALVGHWPVSFYICALATGAFFLTYYLQTRRIPRRYKPLPHPSCECYDPAESQV
ncbi:zinc/manganese transport system permease protein [Thermosporothrix hazakensis]|jgi:zinc/manganese transport system permease protein|uniref:Zinc/manganese transport system permease protein n=2 Tax=Thermosporothrix TaxID=768650 RepID=A0A326U5G5_THEHA|nr:metal ABC transporter permease [Thermosporothrix hazakensis]PZW29170.1 zinc/manganese transport system permease protein [Thermosporothrix hazakensis]BBH86096.1 ABC transporter permease [Thermosporothrix sp. COM3]GCE45479.1 ABC transporter permease [Thermosporothrix hazakensis]